MLEPTPGAPRPIDDRLGEIAAFAVRQTGQLDKSNADKAAAARILTTCDAEWRAALKAARPAKWWEVWR